MHRAVSILPRAFFFRTQGALNPNLVRDRSCTSVVIARRRATIHHIGRRLRFYGTALFCSLQGRQMFLLVFPLQRMLLRCRALDFVFCLHKAAKTQAELFSGGYAELKACLEEIKSHPGQSPGLPDSAERGANPVSQRARAQRTISTADRNTVNPRTAISKVLYLQAAGSCGAAGGRCSVPEKKSRASHVRVWCRSHKPCQPVTNWRGGWSVHSV